MNNFKEGKSIILASGSPRRSLLLKQAGVKFDVVVSEAAEIADLEMSPSELVKANALLKAEFVAEKNPNKIVLGSDTVVAFGGKIFGKPKDLIDAKRMLKVLSGNTHQVFTGIALVQKIGEYACGMKMMRSVEFDTSNVSFKNLSDAQIEDYLEKVYVLDKAGAYAAQECGELIIEKIEGEFDNVMGLPCKLVEKMLAQFLLANEKGEVY